jgi:hypothetical protein
MTGSALKPNLFLLALAEDMAAPQNPSAPSVLKHFGV